MVEVNAPAAITAQPSNDTQCAGAASSFTVGASGYSLTYQWQIFSGSWTDLTNSGVYSTVATSTLNISDVTSLNGAQVRCVVSGGCGSPLALARGNGRGKAENQTGNPERGLSRFSGEAQAQVVGSSGGLAAGVSERMSLPGGRDRGWWKNACMGIYKKQTREFAPAYALYTCASRFRGGPVPCRDQKNRS